MTDIDYQRIANERAVSLAELKGEVDRLRVLLATAVELLGDAYAHTNHPDYDWHQSDRIAVGEFLTGIKMS